MKQRRRIIVVGGGASGMTAAIFAARNGGDVTILEQKDRLGKKILSTGNGKCNFTNRKMDVTCFRGEDTSIVRSVLKQFGMDDALEFFDGLGIVAKDRNGYLYPKSEQATAVADVLIMELNRLKVNVCCNTRVISVEKKKEFRIKTSEGEFRGDAVILATGGKASPVLGSDGSGYMFAKAFGHKLNPVIPALVQLHGKGTFFKMVSGVRVDAKVGLYVDGRLLSEDTGEVQLTNYGISGIPVFQISRYAARALYEKKNPVAALDFMPEYEKAELETFFTERKKKHPGKKAEEFLIGIFNRKLIPILLRAAGIQGESRAEELSKEQIKKLALKCKRFDIEIIGTNSFEQAQICAGGVRTTEINHDTMESVFVDGLYMTGELLDIDGICGGYNLQWAWSTGAVAGAHAAKG